MRISVPTEHTRMSGVSSGTSACGREDQQHLGGLAVPAGLLGGVQHSSACMCGCTQRSCRQQSPQHGLQSQPACSGFSSGMTCLSSSRMRQQQRFKHNQGSRAAAAHRELVEQRR